MSSYLSIYLQPKGGGAKLDLCSWSRNCDIYERLREAGVAYYGNEAEPHYTQLTPAFLDAPIDDVETDKKKAEKRHDKLEKHAAGNADIINEILDWEEHIADLRETLGDLYFLHHIARDIENGCTSFEGLYANID